MKGSMMIVRFEMPPVTVDLVTHPRRQSWLGQDDSIEDRCDS